ncbi:hypothetical protein FF1_023683 [Malus domestica]
MSNLHIIAVPYPAQGHVLPLMELSQCLVNHGFKVTFVNTEFNHKRIVNALAGKTHVGDCIRLVSLPDGLEPGEDRNDLALELIEKINEEGSDKVTCVLADESSGWALDVAVKMKIPRVALLPASAAALALSFNIPKLIHEGIINDEGTRLKSQEIELAKNLPEMKTADLLWTCFHTLATQKIAFQVVVRNNVFVEAVDWLVCNSAYDLQPAAFTLAPEILPIGPILASNRLENSEGNFWPQASTCLDFTVFDQGQFQELALALELSGRPFLWVVRPDTTDGTCDPNPEGYQERAGSRGLMVGWAPQQKVLSHPSIACFLSQCGWNSTLEGLSNGLPFLCWPYFDDQLLNESYICDIWKVGLRFDKNESGIITKGEIKNKMEQLLSDENFKVRASKLKEMAMNNIKEGGQSSKIFKNFIKWMKS